MNLKKMSNKILKKVLDELNSESPRLDYLKGILEVLIGEDDEDKSFKGFDFKDINVLPKGTEVTFTPNAPMDEAGILDAQAKSFLKNGPPQPAND